MGNFLSELGKGFVRSAVNQVGRDGGKVISNSIYGDAHSTPIRNVGCKSDGSFYNIETREIINPEDVRIYADKEGMYPIYSRFSLGLKIFYSIILLFIGAVTFPYSMITFVLPIWLFIKGIKKRKANSVTYGKNITVAQYKADRRYKNGQRLSGMGQETIKIIVPCNDIDKENLKKTGNQYIIIAITFLILSSLIVH